MKCGEKRTVFSIKSHDQKEKYKTGAEQSQTSTKNKGRIRYHKGVTITRRVLFVAIGKTGNSVDNSGIDNGRTISMKK